MEESLERPVSSHLGKKDLFKEVARAIHHLKISENGEGASMTIGELVRDLRAKLTHNPKQRLFVSTIAYHLFHHSEVRKTGAVPTVVISERGKGAVRITTESAYNRVMKGLDLMGFRV